MFFVKFMFIGIGLEGLRMVDRGNWRGAVIFAVPVLLWFWKSILHWFLQERWRDDIREW